MTEGTPPIPEQSRELNRSLTEKVLDRAASDPAWRQQLLDDPQAAMRTANFPETQQLQEMRAGAGVSGGDEVRGQDFEIEIQRGGREFEIEGEGHVVGGIGGRWQCVWFTWYWD
ncbi:MAG: hypothetical protein M3315_12080 [Actinomycetota bacterium]|nr:hypothetical protein [Actinomycetota bacterium]